MRTILIALALLTISATHASIFEFTGTVGSTTVVRGYDTFEDAYNSMQESNLQNTLVGYTGTEAASIKLNFRGMPVYLNYATPGGTDLVFSIPAIGVNQTFTGATRQESQKLWTDYLKNNTNLLEKMQKELVKSSPVDPVAGNPNSLMSRSVQMDYDQMLQVSAPGAQNTAETGASRWGMGINYGQMVSNSRPDAASMKSTSYTLPLGYNHQFGERNHELFINMPLTYTVVDKAKVYDINLGATYRRPVSADWVISTTAGVRAAGSEELASLGTMGNIGIMSSYAFGGESWRLTAGNMISHYRTLTMKANGNTYNPDIKNMVYRNGLLLAMDSELGGVGATSWEFSVVDTRFKGTELFNQYQDEFGVTFGTNRKANSKDADLRIGGTYIRAENSHGFRINFGAWF